MKRLIYLLLLVPVALFAAQPRYARLGEFEGKVEVQLTAADPWEPAARNLALPESTWMRTGPASKLEIELDEGSAWRMGPDSLAELSDYTRLSTGQRVTLLSLDRGIAYFTGETEGRDSLVLAVPGAQVTLGRGARIRAEAQDQWSQISVIEGAVRFSSPAVEMDLREGKSVRVQPANPSRFFLYPDIAALDLDRWSEQRDQALANPPSSGHVALRYGVLDLDAAGEWLQTADLGAVWKPKQQEGFLPYQNGHWRWYSTLGYTWVSDDPWGWLPYHYGRWTRHDDAGWVWAPGSNTVFKPGEVFWLRAARLAGWGPLAPAEQWTAAAPPQQFVNANLTWAAFQPEAALIDPAGFTARPREPLAAAAFAIAMPSPTFVAARLDATRPVTRAGSTRVVPHLPGVTFQTDAPPQVTQSQPLPQQPPVPVEQPQPPPPVWAGGPPPDRYPSPVPIDVIYPVPVYTGVVVVNPPEHPDYSRRSGNRRNDNGNGNGNGNGNSQPPAVTPPPAPAAGNPVPRATDPGSSRREHPPVSSQSPPPSGPITPPIAPPVQTAPPPIRRGDPAEPRREHPPAPSPAPVPKIEAPKIDAKPPVKTPDAKPDPRPTNDTSTSKQAQKQ